MRDGSRRVGQIDEADVGHPREHAAAAERRYLPGKIAEPVAEDREVVRPEVPDDADVGLMQAQIHATRGNEVDLAELARVDEALDHRDRWAVEEGVAGHEDELVLLREPRELDYLLGGGGQRLLDEHVLSGFERGHREGVVARDRRGDRNGIEIAVPQELLIQCGAGDAGKAARDRLEGARPRIAHMRDVEHRRLCEVANEIRAPVPDPDDADTDACGSRIRRHVALLYRRHQPVSRFRNISSGVRRSRRRSRPSDHPRA